MSSPWRDKFEWDVGLEIKEILARLVFQKYSIMVEEHESWIDDALTQDEIIYIYDMLDVVWRVKYKDLFSEVERYVEECM